MMRNTKTTLAIIGIISAFAVAILIQVNYVYAAASTSTQRISVPIDIEHLASDSGCFENIHLTGQLNIVMHTTVSDSGKVLITAHFNPQGVTGVGETTGIKYQGTGVTQRVVNTNVGSESTFVNNFNIIGQGSIPNTDSIEHQTIHLTVNANGVVTVDIDKETSTCR